MQSQMPGRLCQKNLTGTWEETEFGHQDKTRIGTSNDPTKLRGLKLLGTFLSLIYFAQHCRLWNRDPDPVSPTTTLSHEGGKQRAVEGCSRASDLFFWNNKFSGKPAEFPKFGDREHIGTPANPLRHTLWDGSIFPLPHGVVVEACSPILTDQEDKHMDSDISTSQEQANTELL